MTGPGPQGPGPVLFWHCAKVPKAYGRASHRRQSPLAAATVRQDSIGQPFVLPLLILLVLKIISATLVFDPLALEPFDRPKSIAGSMLTLPIAGLVALSLLRSGRQAMPRSWLHLAVLGLFVSGSISTLAAENRFIALFGARGSYQGLIHTIELAVLYFAVALAIQTTRTAMIILVTTAAVALITLVYAGLQLAGLDPADPIPGVITGSVGNRARLGQLAAVVAAGATGLLPPIGHRARMGTGTSAVAGVVLALSLSAIGLLATRSALVALAMAATAAVAVRIRLLGWTAALSRRAVVALLVGVAVLGLAVTATPLGERLRQLAAGVGIEDRLLLYGSGLDAFSDRPLLGFGPDNFTVAYPSYRQRGSAEVLSLISETSTHNFVIQAAVNGGMIGALSSAAFVAGTAWWIWSRVLAARPRLGAALLLGWVANWSYALLSPETVSLTWIPFFIAGAAVGLARPSDSRPQGGTARGRGLGWVVTAVTVALAATGTNAWAAERDARASASARERQQPMEALVFADAAVRKDPSRAQYWQELGLALVMSSRWVDASRAFDEAIDREPHDVTYRSNYARALLVQATEPGATGEAAARARQAAEAAIRVDPEDAEPWFVFAQIANRTGDPEGGLRAAKEAIARFDRSDDYDLEAQFAANQMSDTVLAERLLRETLALKESPVLRMAIAQVIFRRGDRQGAIAELKALLAKYPGLDQAVRMLEQLER